LPGSSVTEGARSLEVRWIFPGQLDAVVAGWFGRFPAGVDSREDSYLLDPDLHGLSVKVRAGGALEVKVYGGSPGMLDVPGRACGRIQSWRKWSFPFSPLLPGGGDLAGWRPVGKRRLITRFSLDSGRSIAGSAPTGQPGCAVELTEVSMGGQVWWSVGFEATGPASLLRSRLEATAMLVFAQALPGVEFGMDNSRSYAEWLGRRQGSRQ